MSRVATTWTIGVLVLLWVPIVLLAAFSFNEARFATTFTAFTLDWYVRLFEDRELRGILVNTLVVAGGSALLSTVLGTMAAMGLRGTFAGKRIAAGLVTLPVMIPDIVLAISLLVLFRAGGIPLSLGTALVAHTTFNLAYVAIVVSARAESLDPSLEAAAMDLGCTPTQAWFKVTLPALAPAIASGALLAFTLSFDDFVITYFTTGPGDGTLPVKIFSMVRHGISPKVHALATLILTGSVVLIVLARALAGTPKEVRT